MKYIIGLLILLSVLFSSALAQVCPGSIEQRFQSGNNNFFTWRLTQVSYEFDGVNTTICYSLADVTPDGTGTAQLSHFVIGLGCDGLFDNFVSATYNGITVVPTMGVDPTTGVDGMKIDSANPGLYCYTFSGEFPMGCTVAALKNANTTVPLQQAIVGLVCDSGGGGSGQTDPTISGMKWYDKNADGIKDADEEGIAGWQIHICLDVDGPEGPEEEFCFVTLTDPLGFWSVTGQEGWYYKAFENHPIEDNWRQTFPNPNMYSGPFIGNIGELDFGNLCLGEGGGRTMGFWGNKNGQRLIDAADLAILVALNLKNGDGSDFDPATKGDVKAFLRKSKAVNMKYMLSAQLIAMVLNVNEGFVDGNALVFAGHCGNTGAGGEYISIFNLMNDANSALADPNATRDRLECLKTTLDTANNNENFVMSSPCPFSFIP